MSDVVVKVEGLGKRYSLRHQVNRHHGLRHVLQDAVISFWKPRAKKETGANRSHEDFWALRDISCEIQQGEVVGIMGRNGAGKSTLLKILSRITDPTTGSIEIDGRVAALLEVGTGFHPELTGRENIFLNGAILGMTRAEIRRKFDEIVAFAEVEKFLDTPVKHYSSGMYVRLAFSVAAHLEPDILIVDEVLAVGDVQFQKKCLGKMQDVSTREGRTVLFVSHNMGALANLCSRGIYLKAGQINFMGSGRQAIERYIHDTQQNEGERIWRNPAEAPGSEKLRFHAVRIVSENKTGGDVSISTEIQVEIDFFNLKNGSHVCPSVHLFDQMGVNVLCTSNATSATLKPDPWFPRAHPAGLYRSRCTIPANFLNEGLYRISAFLHTDVGVLEARADDVVSFTVHDSGEMRKEYSGPWTGVVRVRLDWETEQLDSGPPPSRV
jgi:lipopolysaccharide transport system ATP-binding protein